MTVSDSRVSDKKEMDHSLADGAAPPKSKGECSHGHRHGHANLPGLEWLSGERMELGFAIAAATTLVLGWIFSWASDSLHPLALGFYAASYFFGGYFAVAESLHSIRHGRLEIDSLMVVAAAGAGAIGHWAEGALLLTLFSLGHALEHYAMGRARKSVEALGRLRPKQAIVLRDGREHEIPIEQLRIGDLVVVRADSTISADGIVLAGESGVDQASITGESMPVDKRPAFDFQPEISDPATVSAEHRVFAGTINGAGALKVYVTRLSGDSTLARVMRMVTEAESQRSPTQRLTDRFETYFVPAVMLFVLALLFVFLVRDETFSTSFYRAMAVLVGASPCALAIATPSAVLSAVARGGNAGVLFKGGGPLELLGRVEQIAFDKTGTLTVGKPQLTDIRTMAGVDQRELLRTAAAVERLSPHPLAKSIWREARDRLGDAEIDRAENFQSITGRGVSADLHGEPVLIGTEGLFGDGEGGKPILTNQIIDAVEQLRRDGRTVMIVKRGERFLGVLGMSDTPRPAARAAIESLRAIGIQRMIMLSGDHGTVANSIAKAVGLDEARGDLMPEDKVNVIKELIASRVTAMVGDGVNDAPAMATASVGVAMGAAGSDVAMETADVALMGDDLSKLPLAIGLSRKTASIIRQNLWISLGMVAILIPAGLFGLNLGAAVVFHEGSTVLVVLNALRLLGYNDKA